MSSPILITFFVYVGVGIIAYLFADKLIFQPQPIVYRNNDSFLKLVTPNGEKIAAKFFKNPNAEFTILFSHGNAEEIVGSTPASSCACERHLPSKNLVVAGLPKS